MLPVFLALVVAAAASLAVYRPLQRLGPARWIPAVSRTVAWATLAILLFNVACPASPEDIRPLVLLDGSLSMVAEGGRWEEALAFARSAGDILPFGESGGPGPGDSSVTAEFGRSMLGPALTAAAASGRPVIVVTDGEIDDASGLVPDLLAKAEVHLFPRHPRADVAITRVTGPVRLAPGDTLRVGVELTSTGLPALRQADVVVRSGRTTLLRGRIAVGEGGLGRGELSGVPGAMAPGDHVLEVTLADSLDTERRNDSRLLVVTLTAAPGILLIANPGDWEARFLFQALRDVSALPVKGLVALERQGYRTMDRLTPVSPADVDNAIRGTDLLVLLGEAASFASRNGPRALWVWLPPTQRSAIEGDWYLTAGTASPTAGAFTGITLDSLPPAEWLVPLELRPDDWIGLTVQAGRRGAIRPAVMGRADGVRRRVTVGVGGLWRWAFRGGAAAEAYRAWVAANATWLLAAPDSARGRARPVQRVVPRGGPVTFLWAGPEPAEPLEVVFTGASGARTDTLQFDGAGRAEVRLDPGAYRYGLTAGGDGTVAVEQFSPEWQARRPSLVEQAGATSRPSGRVPARDRLWLFGLAVMAFSAEWFFRRRLGLR